MATGRTVLAQPLPPAMNVELTLTRVEAACLCAIVSSISGCPHNSPRRLSDAIDTALAEAGYHMDLPEVQRFVNLMGDSGLHFRDAAW